MPRPRLGQLGLLLGFLLIALLAPARAEAQLKLAVFANPPAVLLDSNDTPHIAVQIQDGAGHPVCLSQPVTITLTSSNPSVIKPYYPPNDDRGLIKIGPGPAFNNPNLGWTFMQPGGAGSATVTANAPGFTPGATTVTVLPRPTKDLPAASLKLYVVPSVVPASDRDLSNHAVVQVLDGNGNPTYAWKRFPVTFTSSDKNVANSLGYLWPDVGTRASSHLGVGKTPGVTTLSVAAPGLRGDSVPITTFSCSAGTTATATAGTGTPPSPPPLPETLTKEISVASGTAWEGLLPATNVLELMARIAYDKVAGGNFALDVSVNGQRLSAPLRNKSQNFKYADGRTFPYYDGTAAGWLVFYSPDFSANNSAAGGGYQVMTDPGQAYRYQWDISSVVGNSPTVRLKLYNNGRTSGMPVIVRLAGSVIVLPPPTPPSAPGKAIRVLVQDEQGRAVPGAPVRIGASPCAVEGTSDAGGMAILRMPAGCP